MHFAEIDTKKRHFFKTPPCGQRDLLVSYICYKQEETAFGGIRRNTKGDHAMNIMKTEPAVCAKIIIAKKKAINAEFQRLQKAPDEERRTNSVDLLAVSWLEDWSEAFVLSQFADRSDMEIAAQLIRSRSSNCQVQTIIIQSPENHHKLDADLETIETIQRCCVRFHTIVLDENDADQSPMLIFGIMKPQKGYLYSPDYALDILHKAQASQHTRGRTL